MPIGLVGRKCGMTRVFAEDGASVPVTVLHIDANRIVQMKTKEVDGYRAMQLTAGKQLPSRVNKPKAGHFAKYNVEAGLGLWEFPLTDEEGSDYASGQALSADVFEVGQWVDIQGKTKGKGFAGTIKRHHFRSQDATHGNSLSHRAPGSVGMNQSPGRVFPGKKMAGHLGNVYRTAQRQQIVSIDAEKGLLFVKGAVPGAPGGFLVILPTVKGG
ncbi:MAG: 50S ribosomal protein L3 [Gammaproteobacteria bacterium]